MMREREKEREMEREMEREKRDREWKDGFAVHPVQM